MHMDAEFWVALGFVIFVIGLGYLGVHRKLNAALDGRAEKIRMDLAEAERLREEAAAVLRNYEKKAKDAEAEATAIVSQARSEAEMMVKETEARTAEFVARRTKQAETKIALAEAQATADVRAAAAEAAVSIAGRMLKADPQGTGAAELIGQDIIDIRSRLN